jgi:hypothetical protein
MHFRKSISDFENKHVKLQIKPNEFFAKKEKTRCAISWKSTNEESGQARSLQLKNLKSILEIKEIEFFNIQYTSEIDEINYMKTHYNIEIKNIPELDTFNNIYGLMQFIDSCDFVITIGNTNAHLSASLGKTTFLLLPKEFGNFWYWDNEINGINVWHPSIKKFKQSNDNNWEEPIFNLKKHILNTYLDLNL